MVVVLGKSVIRKIEGGLSVSVLCVDETESSADLLAEILLSLPQ